MEKEESITTKGHISIVRRNKYYLEKEIGKEFEIS